MTVTRQWTLNFYITPRNSNPGFRNRTFPSGHEESHLLYTMWYHIISIHRFHFFSFERTKSATRELNI